MTVCFNIRIITIYIALLGGVFCVPELSAKEVSLLIYSGRSEKYIKPVTKAFSEATGIKTIITTGTSTGLLNRLKKEKSKTEADIYISNDAGNLYRGNKLGLFAPVTNKVASVIPLQFRGKNNNWLGLSGRARVLVVNTKAKGIDFVHSIFDLVDPRLKGKIALTKSRNENYIAGVTAYMLSTNNDKAKEWLKGLRKNIKARVYRSQSSVIKAVAKGRKLVGIVDHYSIYSHINKNPNASIRILIPDQKSDSGEPMGVAWNIAGAAIVSHSKHKTLAMKFMTFVSSAQGQKIFAELRREYPTRNDVSAVSMLPKVDSFKLAPVAMYQLGEQRSAAIDLIESVGMP